MPDQIERFTINKDFATTFTEYRKKEEYEKLKNKYGKVKLKDLKTIHTDSSDGEEAEDGSGDSDSDSSDISSLDEEYIDREREEFLVLLDALEKNDPSLKDQNRKWFSDPPKKAKAKGEPKPVLLKDFEREMIINQEFEDDAAIERNEQIMKIDSDAILEKLQNDQKLDKMAFLEAASKAENKKDVQLKTEPQKVLLDDEERKRRLKQIDPSKWKLTKTGKREDEEFLLSYLMNFNEKRLKESAFTKPATNQSVAFTADESALNDADWLIKKVRTEPDDEEAAEEEQADPSGEKDVSNDEEESEDEEDEEGNKVPRSYPRKIEDTYRQSLAKKTRTEKRQERERRKKVEKEAKMKEFQVFKDLKLQEFEERIEKIKKASSIKIKEEDGESKKLKKTLLKMLDDDADWDPELHDKLMTKIFNENFYDEPEENPEDIEKPEFSDIDADDEILPKNVDYDNLDVDELKDAEEDEETLEETSKNGKSKRKRRKKQNILQKALKKEKDKYDPEKYPDFDEYFKKHYKLACEDVINGQKPGEDIYCRFKYRQVKPNDFGLTTDEILNADDKELNKWVSVKRMSQYRDEADEDYDLAKYHSDKIPWKKRKIFKSLYETDEENEEATETSKHKEVKETKEFSQKSDNSCLIDEARLQAAGLDKKQIKSAKWKLKNEKHK